MILERHAAWSFAVAFVVLLAVCLANPADAQTLEQRLKAEDQPRLAEAVRSDGDSRRGAILFFQPFMSCSTCHVAGKTRERLGPDLAKRDDRKSDIHLLESVLDPSRQIEKEFRSVTIVTSSGKSITGLVVSEDKQRVVLRDAGGKLRRRVIATGDIDERIVRPESIMPAGLVNALASRQQFLDLMRFLFEIRDGGVARFEQLRPAPSLYAARPLPEYEKKIDHAGMIASLDNAAFRRGQAIYNRLCINCHGTLQRPGSLPTSLRFGTGKFKNGSDPHTMYQTLTRGFGMMVAQAWMVPQQKYDVIHYVREAFLKPHNPSQYVSVETAYLERLPRGTTRGPKPSNILPWRQMDYGPNLVATYEIGRDGTNFAYKGNAIRLDHGPGGVTQGRHWMLYDFDTLRVAAVWSGEGFIDYNGINFNGAHNIHPRIVGTVQLANPTGPGWGRPSSGEFADPRVEGRDRRRYGPLPRRWARLKGTYAHGNDTLIDYTVGETQVLEKPGLFEQPGLSLYTRTLQIGPHNEDLLLQVAHLPKGRLRPDLFAARTAGGESAGPTAVLFGVGPETQTGRPTGAVKFDGRTRIEISRPNQLNLRDSDFTIFARIRTRAGGTIFAKTADQPKWVPDGKTFFVRGGRLCYDIGWVGAVSSRHRVDDGRPHAVAVSFQSKTGTVRLFVDGKLSGQKGLKPKQPVSGHVARIGYTASNFPAGQSFFDGELAEIRFYQRFLSAERIASLAGTAPTQADRLVGWWKPAEARGKTVPDNSKTRRDGTVVVGAENPAGRAARWLVAGLTGQAGGAVFRSDEAGNLRLRIPAGKQPLRFTLWFAGIKKVADAKQLLDVSAVPPPTDDLRQLTHGGPARWPQRIKTRATLGKDDGPFAVDVLTRPANNPWFCRMRVTGFDFFADGDRMALSSWDGNVWLVSGLAGLGKQGASEGELTWQRIASGLFQPLGVKVVDGRVFVGCRDQICILNDLNGDGETDFYENFNNDHQVTDHFHEFAMGLQTDAKGNFYYAKSARHALTALVPHHGTLLRVSADGSRTDILATGFRAANGVCVNPDGTFIVTDQEGHWNPKNRINWVKPGGFYGNMFGYHDVTDSSNSAMQQPLCWITNAFDRSPAELLWVKSPKWGPLDGSLLNLSYGYGQVYVVPHEDLGGQKQGGMCRISIPRFPTGVMRGRFHPGDGQLYMCGMFAWAGNQQQPGGLYRLRYTGKPAHLPIGLKARRRGMQITFSDPLKAEGSTDPKSFAVKTWSLKRTARYGSKHYDLKSLNVAGARLSADGKTLFLEIPEIQPTWCMEITYQVQSADGRPVRGTIHNTVHRLGP